jgi:hypothetical protein
VDLPDVPVPLLLGLASAGLFSLCLAGLPTQLRIYRGAPARRPRDVSDEPKLQPPEVAAIVRQLEGAGFRRLGEARLDLERTGFSAISWLMLDASETIQAEIVLVGEPMTMLSSYFGDRAAVSTSYPKGERIRDADLVWTTVKSGVAETIERHRAEVADFSRRHGRPVRISTMADYLRWDAIDRELYSVRRLRRSFLVAQVLPLVAYGAAAACILAGYVGWP